MRIFQLQGDKKSEKLPLISHTFAETGECKRKYAVFAMVMPEKACELCQKAQKKGEKSGTLLPVECVLRDSTGR